MAGESVQAGKELIVRHVVFQRMDLFKNFSFDDGNQNIDTVGNENLQFLIEFQSSGEEVTDIIAVFSVSQKTLSFSLLNFDV